MPVVRMPDGALVEMPDNPTAEQLAELERLMPPSLGNRLLRQGGLALRAGVKGAAAVPAMMADAVTGPINFAFGTKIPAQLPALDRAMSEAGVPQPQGTAENVVQDASSAVAGVGGMGGMFPALAALRPGTQMASAATGAGAASLAKENEAPVWGQLLAGLAGAAVPGAAGAAVSKPLSAIRHIAEPWSQSGRDQVKGRLLDRLVGEKRQPVLDSLAENRQFVPGTQNTAATAAAPAGSAELAGAERLLGGKYAASQFADIQKGNQAARAASVGKVSSTPFERGAVKWRLDKALNRGDTERAQELGRQLNQMEEAAKLGDRLTSPLGVETPAKFASGFQRTPSDTFSRSQQKDMNNVLADLVRQQQVKTQGQEGMRGAQEALGETFATIEPPGMLHRPTMILRAVLERIQHGTSQKTMGELAQDFQDPTKIRQLLMNATPEEKQTLIDLLRRLGQTTALGGAQAIQQTGE